MPTHWKVQLFGIPKMVSGDREIPLKKLGFAAPLFAYLMYYCGELKLRETINNALWTRIVEKKPQNSLRVSLNRLKKFFEPENINVGANYFISENGVLWANPEYFDVDKREYDKVVDSIGNATTNPAYLLTLKQCVDQYDHELLIGIDNDWVRAVRRDHELDYVRLVGDLIDGYIEVDQLDDAHRYAEKLYFRDQTNLRNAVKLIRVCVLRGDWDAAGWYLDDVGIIVKAKETRGMDDANGQYLPETDRLIHAKIEEYRQQYVRFMSPKLNQSVSNSQARTLTYNHTDFKQFPVYLNRYVGSQTEIDDLINLLDQPGTRLITIHGSGGVGKTRLVTELAMKMATLRESTLFFVSLEDVTNYNGIVERLLDSLPTVEDTELDLIERIAKKLSGYEAVVIFDNFEHLVVHGVTLVYKLLTEIPTLKIILTSQSLLALNGEIVYQVQPLTLPPIETYSTPNKDLSNYSAVQLFIQRAKDSGAGDKVQSGGTKPIVGICQLLDGIPLAIELAASWLKVQSTQEILTGLEASGLANLADQSGAANYRRSAVNLALKWSLSLLPHELRSQLYQLSIFRGTFTIRAAETVLQSSPLHHAIFQLRSYSLIVVEADQQGATRLRLLQTVRDHLYSALSTGDLENLSNKHAEYYADVSESIRSKHGGGKRNEAVTQFKLEYPNINAAMHWCQAGTTSQRDLGLRIAERISDVFFYAGNWVEGKKRLSEALISLPNGNQQSIARIKYVIAIHDFYHGNFEQGLENYQYALEVWGQENSETNIAVAFNMLANANQMRTLLPEAKRLYNESLAFITESTHPRIVGEIYSNLAVVYLAQADYASAEEYINKSLTIFRVQNEDHCLTHSLYNIGLISYEKGEIEDAKRTFMECEAICKKIKYDWMRGWVLGELATLRADIGDFDTAEAMLAESLIIVQLNEDIPYQIKIDLKLARIDIAKNLPTEALKKLKNVLSMSVKSGGIEDQATALELAACALVSVRPDHSAHLLGASRTIREQFGIPTPTSDRKRVEHVQNALFDLLGPANYESAILFGRGISIEEAIRLLMHKTD